MPFLAAEQQLTPVEQKVAPFPRSAVPWALYVLYAAFLLLFAFAAVTWIG